MRSLNVGKYDIIAEDSELLMIVADAAPANTRVCASHLLCLGLRFRFLELSWVTQRIAYDGRGLPLECRLPCCWILFI